MRGLTVTQITLHPYYYPNEDLPGGGQGFINFDEDHCEQCGRKVDAPNAFTIVEPESKLIALGLIKKKPTQIENGYCDALDGAVCPSCWIPLEEDE